MAPASLAWIDTLVQWMGLRASESVAPNSGAARSEEVFMGGANGLKEITRVAAPVASGRLSVNVFTAPGKAMVGERPKAFGEALGFDPITSTLIFGDEVRPGPVRSSDGPIPGSGSQSVLVDVWIPRGITHVSD
jgi:hypothetical protein